MVLTFHSDRLGLGSNLHKFYFCFRWTGSAAPAPTPPVTSLVLVSGRGLLRESSRVLLVEEVARGILHFSGLTQSREDLFRKSVIVINRFRSPWTTEEHRHSVDTDRASWSPLSPPSPRLISSATLWQEDPRPVA